MKIALIPGHTAASKGATNYRGESEYPWATRILKMSMKYMPKIECLLITRDNGGISEAIRRAKEEGCIASIELHFNAAVGDPDKDIEILVDSHSPKSIKFAKFLAKKEAEEYPGFGLRHDAGAKIDPDRGGNNVEQGVKYGIDYCILWEPQFGHERNADAMELFENDERFAKLLGEAVTEFFEQEGLLDSLDIEIPNAPDVNVGVQSEATLDGLVKALKASVFNGQEKLKAICLSQFMLESGRVRSELSRVHFNFGGIKWRGDLGVKGVSPVQYIASDGLDTYVKCDSYETYFNYYWAFLSRDRYNGWKAAAEKSPMDYLKFILAAGYCPSQTYVASIEKLLPEANALLGQSESAPVNSDTTENKKHDLSVFIRKMDEYFTQGQNTEVKYKDLQNIWHLAKQKIIDNN